jgi:hypothetical protein
VLVVYKLWVTAELVVAFYTTIVWTTFMFRLRVRIMQISVTFSALRHFIVFLVHHHVILSDDVHNVIEHTNSSS